MKKPELTLDNVKRRLSEKRAPETFRASDFLDEQGLAELRHAAAEGKKKARRFDDIDALGAEICARFGYDAYTAWNEGELDTNLVFRWIRAERARESGQLLDLESVIIQMVGACIRLRKGDKRPKGPSEARKIWQNQLKRAKGEI